MMSVTGEPDRPPVRCGTAVVDLHGSLALVVGILGALIQRANTGRGQRVEASLLLSAAHLMSYFYTEYWMDGTVHRRMGTANHLSVPNQAFPTKDGDVVIIASTDEMWDRVARALQPERLAVPEFEHVFDRLKNRALLVETLSSITSGMTSADLVERLVQAKVVVAKVNSIAEAADSPQLDAVGGKVMLDMGLRQIPSVAMPFQMSDAPFDRTGGVPGLGAHVDEVLGEFGFAASEIARLRADGVFGDPATAA
jgi:crotonobetainyl-CoA:carnitine CoA-transferase CaiB-like acyl-CoA transferase